MGYRPIPRVPPRRSLTAEEKAERTVERAKRLYAAGELSLERLAEIADLEYRPFFGLPRRTDSAILRVAGSGGDVALVGSGGVVAIIPGADEPRDPGKPRVL